MATLINVLFLSFVEPMLPVRRALLFITKPFYFGGCDL